MTTSILDRPTGLVELPGGDLSDEDFQLDVQIVISESPVYAFNCPTSDGCGDTCANGASACVSSIEDAA
ncbi:FxLD family lanthipeptide [Streptomyces sp. NPDC058657]|uniref:FxLD family lanthipeptide n=1 Tax=unclassified Streptomyces TaxID=2593676 RepID=UPI0036460872